MPLGYKYAERDVTSEVDWSAIGKGLSDMLTNENDAREKKKAAIDQASREYANKLAEAPQGEHIGMNQWALNYANDAQQARLLQDRLLKSGKLKLKDYTIQRQNLLDGTDQAFNLTKEYQAEYQKKMDAYKNGETQDLTNFLMADAEGFSNFSNTKLYINPTDYSLNIGKMVKNPDTGVMEMSGNPNDFATIDSLRNRIKSTYAKYDVVGNVKSFVDGLGTELDAVAAFGSINKTGSITSTLTQMKTKGLPAYTNFEKAETAALEARLPTPYDYTSVLTNTIKMAPNNEQYTFTWDEKEAKKNENLILLKTDPSSGNPTPQLTDNQKKDVIEHMRVEARLMYDSKKTIEETAQFREKAKYEWEYNRGDTNSDLDTTATMIGSLWGGSDGAAIKKSTNAFRDINPAVQKVERTPTKVLVTLKTKDGQTIRKDLPFRGRDGKLMTQQEFILSAAPLLAGNADWKSAIERGGYLKNAKFNDKSIEVSSIEEVKPAGTSSGSKAPR